MRGCVSVAAEGRAARLLRMVAMSVGTLLASTVGQAQSIAHCRVLAEAQSRLACYDALPGPAVGTPLPAPAVMPPTVESVAVAPTNDFGLEARKRREEDIRSALSGAFTGWGPRSRLRLANGQLWEIVDGTRTVYMLDSPGVRIVRGALGAYYMEVDGVNQRPRVRRIE